jgi:hypothetical protein
MCTLHFPTQIKQLKSQGNLLQPNSHRTPPLSSPVICTHALAQALFPPSLPPRSLFPPCARLPTHIHRQILQCIHSASWPSSCAIEARRKDVKVQGELCDLLHLMEDPYVGFFASDAKHHFLSSLSTTNLHREMTRDFPDNGNHPQVRRWKRLRSKTPAHLGTQEEYAALYRLRHTLTQWELYSRKDRTVRVHCGKALGHATELRGSTPQEQQDRQRLCHRKDSVYLSRETET